MDDEKLVPLNIPPYQHEEEDRKVVLQIKGLKFSYVVNPKPFAPVFHFEMNNLTTSQDVPNFLNSIPDEFELFYFHPFNTEKTAAGTIVTVQKSGAEYRFCKGSHGQDKIWRAISEEKLLQELFAYRHYQTFGTIKVSRR